MPSARMTEQEVLAQLQPEMRERYLRANGVTSTSNLPNTQEVRRVRAPRGPNKTEQRYAQELDRKYRAGLIRWYGFEKVTLKLADDTRYTPDFVVQHNDGSLEVIEVKGAHIWDDSKVKFKVAPEMFPWISTWSMVQYTKEHGWRTIKVIEKGKAA